MNVPADLQYTPEHEWVRKDGDLWVVGITDHAQMQLGDVVFVELPEVGTALQRGRTFGTVESVKAVSDLFAPLSGTVREVNTALRDGPDALNTEPYGKAWIIKMDASQPAELEALLTADAYQKLL